MKRSSRCRWAYLFPRTKRNSLGKNAAAQTTSRLKPPTRADDGGILPAQFPLLLTARKRGNENVGEKIVDHDKDHGQPAERADFRDRTGLTREKTDEKNGDLSLETKKDRRWPPDSE